MDTTLELLSDDDEDHVMQINEIKVKWFALLSRVDASPTTDEMVLSSLNSIANFLVSHRALPDEYDFLFNAVLKLGIFECIFRWNFIFTGADLEAFKSKELQFYDTLITDNGKYYLRFPEFSLPLLATLHHCAIRSCLAVERILVRTLNSVCVAFCTHYPDLLTPGLDIVQNGDDRIPRHPLLIGDELFTFRRWCLGLVDLNQVNGCKVLGAGGEPDTSPIQSPTPMTNLSWRTSDTSGKPHAFPSRLNDSMDNVDSSCAKLPNIDSIFDLLVPFVFREGDLCWQARDSLLLVATYSLRDEEFSLGVAQHSSMCPILSTGLAALYADLPRRLVPNNLPESWPPLLQSLETKEQRDFGFREFYSALDFCQSLLEVAHPIIQSNLLHCMHSAFFVSVLGFSLNQSDVESVITATLYLKQLILRTTKSALLPALLRFLLTRMPEDSQSVNAPQPPSVNGQVESHPKHPSEQISEVSSSGNQHALPKVAPTYMDLLISRLHYCNTLLGVATLSLFNTLLSLNCEDIMFYLVLRYLVPFRDSLLSHGWIWPETSSFAKAAGSFLDLIATYEVPVAHPFIITDEECQQAPISTVAARGSIAELNLDDEAAVGEGCNGIIDSDVEGWDHESIISVSSRSIETSLGLHPFNTQDKFEINTNTMDALMSVHSESRVVNSLNGSNKPDLVVDTLWPPTTAQNGSQLTDGSITPDDWFNYTSWARETIANRSSSCRDWRLSYDRTEPETKHLMSLKHRPFAHISNDSSGFMEIPPAIFADRGSFAENPCQSPFDCFTTQPLAVTDSKQRADGEAKARAIRAAMINLDLNHEFDMDDANPCGLVDDVVIDHEMNTQNAVSSSSIAAKPLDSPSAALSTESIDSGCLVTERTHNFQSVVANSTTQLHSSMSDCQISPSSRQILARLSDAKRRKSWYCLNYMSNEMVNFVPEDNQKTNSHQGPNVKRRLHSKEPAYVRSENDLHALLCASEAEDLDKFITCLAKLDCPDICSIDQQNQAEVNNVDLTNYFDGMSTPFHKDNDYHGALDSSPTSSPATYACVVKSEQNLAENIIKASPISFSTHRINSVGSSERASASITDIDKNTVSSTHFLNSLLRRHSAGTHPPVHTSTDFGLSDGTKSQELDKLNNYQAAYFPTLGPFLTTILARLECLPHNCFYANLYLTNILSTLAAYSLPLLRAIILFVPPSMSANSPPLQEGTTSEGRMVLNEMCCQLPHAVLSAVRRQLDLFALHFTTQCAPDMNLDVNFMDLVTDAKQYFRVFSEFNSPIMTSTPKTVDRLVNGSDRPSKRPSLFRRIFSRRKSSHQSDQTDTPQTSKAKSAPQISGAGMDKRSSVVVDKRSRFTWLPEPHNDVGKIAIKSIKRRGRSSKKLSLPDFTSTDWLTTQRMVLCAVVFEEFCKELAALCVEHSIQF